MDKVKKGFVCSTDFDTDGTNKAGGIVSVRKAFAGNSGHEPTGRRQRHLRRDRYLAGHRRTALRPIYRRHGSMRSRTMTKTKFTPGPWRACKEGECTCGMIWSEKHDAQVVTAYHAPQTNAVVAGAHTLVGDGPDMIYQEVPLEMAKANAKLVAAAPDLYEALETLLDDCSMSASEGAQLVARAALAKARGEIVDEMAM